MSRTIHVHPLPSLIPPRSLRGGVAVVIDILRATTVMVQALASGAREIVPCLEIDEAVAVAGRLGGGALLAGERTGLPIEGFHFGNSPSAFSAEACGGRTIVMTTTNGTKALLASLEAGRLLVGAFQNRGATVEALRTGPPDGDVHLVCAGTDGLVSLEDSFFAGSIVAALAGNLEPGNDEARLMGRLWRDSGVETSPPSEREERLFEILAEGRGGRRVREIGLESDLRDVCRIDRHRLVAEVLRDPARVVAATRTP